MSMLLTTKRETELSQRPSRDLTTFVSFAALTMDLDDVHVELTGPTTTTTTTHTVTLPYVGAAKGQHFSFHCNLSSSAGFVITDKGDDADWTDVTLDVNKDSLIVESNGVRWLVVHTIQG